MVEEFLFRGVRLRGGFLIEHIEYVNEPMVDVLGRQALAHTEIVDRRFRVQLSAKLNTLEKSVTLYHEILEAMAVATDEAPASVQEFNEGDFERAAYEAQKFFGTASPGNLNALLQSFGFPEEFRNGSST